MNMTRFHTQRFGSDRCRIESNTATPLTDDQLRGAVPSLFAAEKHESRSGAYTYVPTIDILTQLRREGFAPYSACQTRARDGAHMGHTKHMIRLRRAEQCTEDVPEVIVVNAHNGTSSYQMMAGVFRFVCANGLIVADDAAQEIRIPHKGDIVGEVIEGAYRIVKDFEVVREAMNEMKGVRLSSYEQITLAESALALRWPDGAPIDAALALAPRRYEDKGNEAWTVLNRLQENLVRGGLRGQAPNGRRQRTRAVNGIGMSVALNRQLWALTQKMVALKAH